MALTSTANNEVLVVVRGLNIQPTLTPVFRSPGVKRRLPPPAPKEQVRPFPGRVSSDNNTVSAVFDLNELDPWLDAYARLGKPRPWTRAGGTGTRPRFVHAKDVPIRLRDNLTGKLVQRQTIP